MLKKRELEAYCGDLSQMFYIQECVLESGKAKGTRAFLIENGAGLSLTVLADKCMAIPRLRYKGKNIGFVSKTGICAPEFFQEEGTRGFLRNFEAGFLTTCGLTYFGTPCEVNGQKNGLHGVISNTPVENLSYGTRWEDDQAYLTISGDAREGYLFGPNLVLHREFVIPVGEDCLEIHDRIENRGFEEAPYMVLYHFNYGFPFMTEECEIYSSYDKVYPRDPHSANYLEDIDVFTKPIPGFEEVVAYKLMSDTDASSARTLVYNPSEGMAVEMLLNPQQLPVLNQWKSPRAGDYVLGMEPGTGTVGGLEQTKKEGLLQWIQPGEVKQIDITVNFLSDQEQINQTKRKVGKGL